MSNDRSWINQRTNPDGYGWTKEYCDGVQNFLEFAEKNCTQANGEISCPCNTCKNRHFKSIEDVEFDLFATGFLESYIVWDYHGEGNRPRYEPMNIDREDVFDQYEMLRDAFGEDHTNPEEPNSEASRFYTNLHDLDTPIYPRNTKFTKLTFVMRLVHFKSQNNCSDTGFDELLSLIAEVLPDEHTLPLKYRDIKKMVKKINLGYEKIHACENDCMLFYGEEKDNSHCKYCELSRYKDAKEGGSNTIPRKVLRYFPLTTRLQRLYMSARTAEHMKWYKNRVVTEGVLSHPADGEEWKEFDKNHPDFAREIRNVRLIVIVRLVFLGLVM